MKRALTKSHRGAAAMGASATGAAATGAASLGALAMGAMALGAVAVGALAIGRLSVRRARLRRVEIGELAVGRLEVGAFGMAGEATAVARIRAAPGRGDALEELLLAQMAEGALFFRALRSRVDPELFLIQETCADPTAPERRLQAPRLDAVLLRAAVEGLAAEADDQLEVYRTV